MSLLKFMILFQCSQTKPMRYGRFEREGNHDGFRGCYCRIRDAEAACVHVFTIKSSPSHLTVAFIPMIILLIYMLISSGLTCGATYWCRLLHEYGRTNIEYSS